MQLGASRKEYKLADKKQISEEELEIRFKYHPPKPGQVPIYEDVRRKFLALAKYLSDTIPEGREKNVAFTHLEQAQFAANAAIARRS